MTVTCYVLEDGSVAHPREVKRDASGILRHSDGRAVAMRGDVPRTRSVEPQAQLARPAQQPDEQQTEESDEASEQAGDQSDDVSTKDLRPSRPRRGYRTRESKAE